MAVIVILILASLGLALTFLMGFIWAVRSGQYEDPQTPALRILTDDTQPAPPPLSPREFQKTTPA
ncbi:MAG: cbb3-type cytochrome oxidase assembly protein CcoS [Verrucomicrobia bacterium]|jgi:cbb3-type cytochrome oxidase maturation protein|nr:cbb3-type cytochrome oxidase assembly protein CcoS [Verrucomicrobiota bacterium]